MYSNKYRVLLVTTHIPVADIPSAINAEKIYNTIVAGYEFARLIDTGNIKIAIAGLDPHCGDEGAIGTFDMDVTMNSVLKAQKSNINIDAGGRLKNSPFLARFCGRTSSPTAT